MTSNEGIHGLGFLQKGGNSNRSITLRSPFAVLFFLMLFPAPPSMYGAAGVWSSCRGPGGGSITALAIDPTSPQTIYAGTHEGVFKSTDAGDSWSPTGLTDTEINALAIDPTSPQTIYAVSYSGVAKTTDAGSSWSTVLSLDITQAVTTLVIDPISPPTIYAGETGFNIGAGHVIGGGVVKSTNGGGSWTITDLTNTHVYTLAIDPTSPQTIYAATVRGMFKSTDAGDSWSPANTGLYITEIHAIAIDPASPQTIYAGTDGGGVFKSTDGGGSWSTANTGLTDTEINTLTIDPTSPQTIYAGTDGGGVFTSTNGGGSWSTANTGLTDTEINTLAIDPTSPQTIYTGTLGGGVFKSTDGGYSWSDTGPTDTHIYALAIDPTSPQTIYAGTHGGGVLKSMDGSGSWSAANTGLTDTEINTLAIDPTSPQTIYAGTDGGGVFKSTNGGGSWSAINVGLDSPMIYALAIDPTSPQTIYAGTFSSGVFESADAGDSWSIANTGLANTRIHVLAIDPISPDTVYAGSWGAGVWVYSPPCSSLSAGGATKCETGGASGATRVGYAKLTVRSGATPYGTAVFSFKQNGVTVSEAGVPASPPTTRARLFIDYRSGVAGHGDAGTVDIDTGIAIVNYGSATANITYTLRNVKGTRIAGGRETLAAGAHFAKFIDQLKDVASGFNLPSDFPTGTGFGSLEILSDQPLSVVALRETINQRHDPLVTTTPIADLTQPPATDPIYFPQFVDGGGYTTTLVLLNTSGNAETGTLQIFDDSGAPLAVNQVGGTTDSSFKYSIPVGGVFRFQTDGFPASARAGWVLLTPDAPTSTPVGAGVFSYSSGGVLVSESGIPAAASTMHARVYVDLSRGHDTGLAIANPASASANVTIKAYRTDGVTAVGTSQGPLQLPGNGHSARFATELIAGLPAGFTGVLDITSETPFAALTLRSLNNERNDFLMTTFPIADADRTAPSPVVFPQIADGGGFVTEFILLNASGASKTTLSFYDNEGRQLAVGK